MDKSPTVAQLTTDNAQLRKDLQELAACCRKFIATKDADLGTHLYRLIDKALREGEW